MARTVQINYQRVTFSFPKKVINLLHEKIPNSKMSQYVANLVEEDLSTKKEDWNEFFSSLDKARNNFIRDDKRDSLEILREIRYGKN